MQTRKGLIVSFSAMLLAAIALGYYLIPRTASAQATPPTVIVDRDPLIDVLQHDAWAGPGLFSSATATAGNQVFIEATGNRQFIAATFINSGSTRLDVFCPPGTLVGQIHPGATTAVLCQLQAFSDIRFDSVDIGRGTKTQVRWVVRKS